MSIAVGIALTTDPERSRGHLENFCRNLSEAIQEPVTAHGMWHYHHLVEALEDGELDLVWLPPVLALRAASRNHCVPIALPVRHGVSTYSTALFTRPDSGIETVDDLRAPTRRLTAAWVDRQSAAGYLIIRALLKSQGIDLATSLPQDVFLGNHEAVADAVLAGEADVGATFVYLDPDASTGTPKVAGWGDRAVHVVAVAGSIPSDVIAINPAVDADRRQRIQDALVNGTDAELTHAARRLVGADSFIAPLRRHLDTLLKTLEHLEAPQRGHTRFPPPPRV